MTRTTLERLALYAREDARDSVRERIAHVVIGLFVLLGAGLAYSMGRSASRSASEVDLVPGLVAPFALLIPLIALAIVSGSVVEKRTSGSLSVLLGLPFSRRTVVLGTLLGQCLVLCTAVLAAIVVAVPIGLAMGVAVDPAALVGGTIALIGLAVTFTAIALSISTITRTSTRASFAAFGAYVVFVFQIWGQLPRLVLYVRHGLEFPETTPTWVEFVASLNPMTAFANALGGVFPALASGLITRVPDDPAVYEQPGFAVGVLLGWIVGAVALGYWRFRATDL